MAEKEKRVNVGDMTTLIDTNAEMAVLASINDSLEDLDKRVEAITESLFYDTSNRAIAREIIEAYNNGEGCDYITVLSRLKEKGAPTNTINRINEIIGFSVSPELYSQHVSILYDKMCRRDMAFVLSGMIDRLKAGENHVQVATEIMDEVNEIYRNSNIDANVTAQQAVDAVMDFCEEIRRPGHFMVATGFSDLDKILGTLHAGNVVVLGGRPGMGKSVACINIAMNMAAKGIPVGIINYEMSTIETTLRMMSRQVRRPLTSYVKEPQKVYVGEEAESLSSAVLDACGKVGSLPLIQRDNVGSGKEALRAAIKSMVKTHSVAVVFIDYLQLIVGDRAAESRNVEITHISTMLKQVAKELGIIIVVLSQLNRGVEARKDKRPLLSDLRESGSIEQDADIVLFAYRGAYYLSLSDGEGANDELITGTVSEEDVMEIIVAKNRSGVTGIAKLYYEADCSFLGNRDWAC